MKRLAVFCVSMVLAGCATTGPAYDPGPRPDVGGSIAGRVSANDGATALGARKVTAINVSTGARYDVSTASNGGYTVRVPPGMYKLEVELRSGETLTTQPESTEVDTGDLDAGRDFVVTVARR
jgi:hypothetical protein